MTKKNKQNQNLHLQELLQPEAQFGHHSEGRLDPA